MPVGSQSTAVHIRTANPGDAPQIARVHVEGWQTTYRGLVADALLDAMSVEKRTDEWRRTFEQPNVMVHVAETDRQVVAFAMSGPERSGRGDYRGELYAIYLLQAWRSRGIGRSLVRKTAAALRGAGHSNMLVWVFADNPNRRFYEALGGKLVGQQPIDVGPQRLIEVAYAWDDLAELIADRQTSVG